MPEPARGPRRYSAKYKAQILDGYERLDKAGKGALLRREGLYTSLISEWRKQRRGWAATVTTSCSSSGERPTGPRDEAGAFVNLVPNGRAVLDALGIGRDVAPWGS